MKPVKHLIALTLASAISTLAFADTTTTTDTTAPEVVKPCKELVENGFAGKGVKFAEALNLTEEQKAAIETALISIRANLPAKDSVTLEEYIEAQVAAREAAKAAIDGVLTAEQKELLLTLQTRAHKEEMDGKPPVVKPPVVKPPVDGMPPVVKPPVVKPPVVLPPVIKPPVEGKPPVKPICDATVVVATTATGVKSAHKGPKDCKPATTTSL